MLVKCKKCGKKINKNDAYKYVHITKSSKKNMYYCDRDEFHSELIHKKYYNKTRLLVDVILNYTCVSNQKNRMITNLYKIGYSSESVFNCMKHYSDVIIKYMERKNIDSEYGKLRYIFTVVENNIRDFVITEGSKNIAKINTESEIEVQEEVKQDIEIVSQPKNRRKSLKDRLKGE